MADLNKIANNIEEILDIQVQDFLNKAHNGDLKSYEVKTIETLAKITGICKMWQDKMPSSSYFDNLTTDELTNFFEGEDEDVNEGGGESTSATAPSTVN